MEVFIGGELKMQLSGYGGLCRAVGWARAGQRIRCDLVRGGANRMTGMRRRIHYVSKLRQACVLDVVRQTWSEETCRQQGLQQLYETWFVMHGFKV